jgi:hypothetical protein
VAAENAESGGALVRLPSRHITGGRSRDASDTERSLELQLVDAVGPGYSASPICWYAWAKWEPLCVRGGTT